MIVGDGRIGRQQEPERLRHDAHDRDGTVVDLNPLAHEPGVCAVASAPHGGTQKDARRRGLGIVSVPERPAERRVRSKHLKEVRGDQADPQLLGFRLARQRRGVGPDPGEAVEQPRTVAKILQFRSCERRARVPGTRQVLPHEGQPIGIAVWQRRQQKCTHDREDRRGGANAQGQHQDDHAAEGGGTSQAAPAVDDITPERLQHVANSPGADGLRDMFGASELEPRGASCGIVGQPTCLVPGGQLVERELQLRADIVFERRCSESGAKRAAQSSDPLHGHQSASSTWPIATEILSQFFFSVRNCFRPAALSAYTFARRPSGVSPHWPRMKPSASSRCSAGKQRARLHHERPVRDLGNPVGDRHPVPGLELEGLQNQQVERAAQEVGRSFRHRVGSCSAFQYWISISIVIIRPGAGPVKRAAAHSESVQGCGLTPGGRHVTKAHPRGQSAAGADLQNSSRTADPGRRRPRRRCSPPPTSSCAGSPGR